ncbi:hypothetical protein BDF14DRAFT_1711995, partial [Spinellus fusiger]
KRNRRLSNDAQWCIGNQTTLSIKSFAEHFGLLERQYTNARYRTLVTKYISDSDQLLDEYNNWNNSEECILFWTAKQRKKNRLNAEAGVVDYLGDIIGYETNILLLTPDQHSKTLLEVFSEVTLNSLHSSLINKFDSHFKETDIDQEAHIVSQISRIIAAVEKKEIDQSEAELKLLTLARGKEYCLTRTIKAINNLLKKVPTNAIKDIACISESELFTTYVDPILSSLVSDPERNTLLRWSNKTSKENDFRLDATITKLKQMKYHHNLGHGEI